MASVFYLPKNACYYFSKSIAPFGIKYTSYKNSMTIKSRLDLKVYTVPVFKSASGTRCLIIQKPMEMHDILAILINKDEPEELGSWNLYSFMPFMKEKLSTNIKNLIRYSMDMEEFLLRV